jgi:hypothetical protein
MRPIAAAILFVVFLVSTLALASVTRRLWVPTG